MDVLAMGLIGIALSVFGASTLNGATPKDRAGNSLSSPAHARFVESEVNRCKATLPSCHGLLITYRSGRCECRPKK